MHSGAIYVTLCTGIEEQTDGTTVQLTEGQILTKLSWVIINNIDWLS